MVLLLARVGSVVLPVTYMQNKQKLSNLFCVSLAAVNTLPVSVANVSLVPFRLHNLGLHLSQVPLPLPPLPPLPHSPHSPHFPLHPLHPLHPAHPAHPAHPLHHPWHHPHQTDHHQHPHHRRYHRCHYHRCRPVYLRTKIILKCLARCVSVGISKNTLKEVSRYNIKVSRYSPKLTFNLLYLSLMRLGQVLRSLVALGLTG